MATSEKMNSIKRLVKLMLISSVLFYLIFFKNVFNRRFKLSTRKQVKSIDRNASEFKIKTFLNSIKEEQFHSTQKQDGVLLSLIKLTNMSLRNGFYVEMGVKRSFDCNSRYLREKYNWKGVSFDQRHKNSNIKLFKEKVDHTNVLQLLAKHQVPEDFDILMQELDYSDYWVLEKLLTKYRPKIVLHEVNKEMPRHCVTVPKTVNYDKNEWKHKTRFYGASVCAFSCLAKKNNFTMVNTHLTLFINS